MWKSAFSNTRSFLFNIGVELLVIATSALVSVFLVPIDPYNLSSTIQSDPLLMLIYTINMMFILYLFTFLGFLLVGYPSRQKNKLFTKLAQARTEGVSIKNEGVRLSSAWEFDEWVAKFDDWHTRTYKDFEILDPTQAELWKTLDTFETYYIAKADKISGSHAKYLNMLKTKIDRLKTFIDDNYDPS